MKGTVPKRKRRSNKKKTTQLYSGGTCHMQGDEEGTDAEHKQTAWRWIKKLERIDRGSGHC